ncbi:hypothetical protein Tco_1037460 [Tanacetum coccineum]
MVLRAVLMKSGLVSINTARQNISKTAASFNTTRQVNTAHPKTIVNAARPMVNTVTGKEVNIARPKVVINAVKGNNVNAVKASSCWVWEPKTKVLDYASKHNSASITLKKFDYIDAQGRSKLGIDRWRKIIGKCTIKTGEMLTQPNNVNASITDNAGQARKVTEPVKDYILLPLWTADPPFSQDPKSPHDDGSKPLSDDGSTVNVAGTNKVNAAGENISIELPFNLNMHALEDIHIFNFSNDDEDDGKMTDMNNLDTTIQVSPISTTRIHKDHPLDQVTGDLHSAT